MRIFFICLALCTLLFQCTSTETNTKKANPISLVPQVQFLNPTGEVFLFSQSTYFNVSGTTPAQQYGMQHFNEWLYNQHGLRAVFSSELGAGGIFFRKMTENIQQEAYQLDVYADSIVISAADEAGFYNALQTLKQLFPISKDTADAIEIPTVQISDFPRFKWRGMHLDVCRHFYTVNEIKALLDQMALLKLNVFHWHLTDDQGWRIEVKRYPLLTEIGAWRNSTLIGHAANRPEKFDSTRYGGFYTQEEIKSIVQYAFERQITVVPEIEMPGHAVAALAAYKHLGCFDKKYEVWNKWGVSDDVFCAGKETTFHFIDSVFQEIIPLFPSEYIHIGGDECPKSNWEMCPNCQKRMRAEGLKTEMELQSYFIKRVEKILARYSKKTIGWDEIMEGGLAPNAAVMSWRGEEGGIQAANAGHYVVMTPNNEMYFDHYQGTDTHNEPLSIGGLTTLDDVYAYDPIPHELDSAAQKFVMGVQANLWTEYITNASHLQYMIFPRLCALAEIAWTMPQRKDRNDFLKRMSFYYARLDAAGINYRLAPPVIPAYIKTINSEYTVSFEGETPGAFIRYTTDGTIPTENSTLYQKPFTLNVAGKITLTSATFLANGKKSQPHTTIIEKVNLREPDDIKISGNGLRYLYYEGITNSASDIKATLMKRGRVYAITYPEKAGIENMAITLETVFNAPESGMYTFYTYSDDGSVLFIGNEKVVDNDGDHGARRQTGQIALKKGLHKMRISHYQSTGGMTLEAGYSVNNQPLTPFNIKELFLELRATTNDNNMSRPIE